MVDTRYEGHSSWEELAAALDRKAGDTAGGPERAALYIRVGAIYGDRLLRKGEAMTFYQKAAKQDPSSREALRKAREIYSQMGKVGMIGKLVDIELKTVDDPGARCSLLIEKAWSSLIQGKLQPAMEAFRAARDLDPGCEEARTLVGDLDAQDDFFAHAVDIEEQIRNVDPSNHAMAGLLYVRAGIMYRREDEIANALRCFEQACRINPKDGRALALFEETALQIGEPARVYKLYDAMLRSAGDAEAKIDLLLNISSRIVLRFEDMPMTASYLSAALDLRPDHEGAFLILVQIAGEDRDALARAALYAEKAAGETKHGDARIFFLMQAIDIYRKRLEDTGNAERLLADLSQTGPGRQQTPLDGSGAAHAVQEDAEMKDSEEKEVSFEDSVEVELDHSQEPEDRPGPAAGGILWLEPDEGTRDLIDKAKAQSGNPAKALAAWRDILAKAPRTEEAFAGILRTCGETEKWNYAVEAHKKVLSALPEDLAAARVEMMLSMARLYREKMNQETSSISIYQQALKIQPDNDESITTLLDIYQRMNRWPDYVKLLAQKAEGAGTTDEKVAGLIDVATIYLDRFNNQGEAMKCYERVLELDPGNDTASSYLVQMYEKRRDWEKLIQLSLGRIQADPAGHFTELVELATLADERLRKPPVSIDLWSRVLSVDSSHSGAINALSSLYERNRQWAELASILRKQADLEMDEAGRKQILLKLGLLYTDKVEDDASAVRTWRELLAMDPGERRAIDQLKKRYISMRAWDEIEAFYEETDGKWDELVRLLEKEADSKDTSVEEKVSILYRVAHLYRDRIGNTERGASALEKILDLDPGQGEAAELLIPIYEQSGSFGNLARVLEIKLGRLENEKEKFEIMIQIAAIQRDSIGDPGATFDWYVRALTTVPSNLEELVESLQGAARASGRFADLVGVYSRVLEAASGQDEIRLKLLKAAVVHEHLRENENALALYNEVLEADENNPEALAKVEAIYGEMGRYDVLQSILEKRLDLTLDPDEKIAIRRKIAAIYDEALGDRKKAIEAYRQILLDSGDDLETLVAMGQLMEAEGRWEDLLGVMERQMAITEPGSDAYFERLLKSGKICEEKLGDVSRAFDAYRDILAARPDHAPAMKALEAFIEDDEHKGEVARLLEPILEKSEDWQNLARCLLILSDEAEDVVGKVEYLRRVSELYIDKMGAPEKAFVTNGKALRLDPSSPEIMNDLEQIAEVLDAWGDLDDLLHSTVTGAAMEDDVKRLLWHKMAQIRHVRIEGRIKDAIVAYRKVVELDPGNLDSLGALEMLFQETEQWQDLQEVYKQKIEVVIDESEKRDILFRLAMLYTEMLEAPEEAINAYREILNLSPEDAQALTALERLYEGLSRWSDLADNLQAQLSLVSDEAQVTALRIRLGALREEKMGEIEGAIETYREILASDPMNVQAIDALERLVLKPEHELTVAEILEPIYRERRDWQNIVKTSEIFIRHSESAERRVELLCQIGEMYELAGDDPQKAFDSYARAIKNNPMDENVQANLDRLGRVLDIMARLIEVYEGAISSLEDPELKAGIHRKVAGLYEVEVGDMEGAIRHYREIIGFDASSIEAIEALERIYTASERYVDLATIYRQKAEVVSDPVQKKELYLGAGRIYEEMLEDIESAGKAYATILEVDAEDQTALDKLAHLYWVQEKWTELLDVLRTKADLVLDVEEKKNIHMNMGEVFLEKLTDVDHAVDCFIRVTELDPDDVHALRRLDEIYTKEGRWNDLLSIVQREADLALDPTENLTLRHRIGKLHEEHLDDVPKAIETYREILSIMPDFEMTIHALEGLIASGREPSQAAIVLEPIYDANAEWQKLVGVLEVQIKAEEDAFERVGLLHRIATYEEDERYIGNSQEAFRTYARALHEDPHNDDTLSALERLSESLHSWQDLAAEYDKVLESKTEDQDVQIVIGLRAARVYEEEMGSIDAAITRFGRVVKADSRNAVAIHSLSRLYRVTQQWDKLLGILDLEMDIAATEEEALELKFIKAQICYQDLQKVDEALETYRDILAVNPDHNQTHAALELLFDEGIERPRIFDILQPLYEMTGEWEKLCAKAQAIAAETRDPAEKIDRLFHIATVYESKLLDSDRAFEWYGQAFMVDPKEDRAAAELDRLSDVLGEWQRLADLLKHVLATREEKDVRMPVGKKLAAILEERMGDPHTAMEVYVLLMEIDGSDTAVLEPLDRLYTAAMEWEPLAVVLEHRIRAEQEDEDKVELLTRYGKLLQLELGRMDEAVAAFRRIVDDLGVAHPPALEGLEAIYMEQGKWTELFKVLEMQIDTLLGESDQADVYAKMANVAALGLDSPDRAIELWNKVLDIRGDDPEALEALGELYHGLERWSDLVAVLERGILALTDDTDRIRMYEKLGRIWSDKLERDRNALECWDNILAIDPGNVLALTAKAEIFTRMEEWEDLIDTLNQITDFGSGSLDPVKLRDVYAHQAHVYTERLDRPLDAIESWQKVLGIDAADMEAIDALVTLYSQQEMWEEYVGVISRKAPLVENDGERIALWLEVALTWSEKLLMPANAAEAYEEVLRVDPLHDHAFSEIERLYNELDNPAALVQVYLNRYEVTVEQAVRTQLLLSAAKQYEDRIGDEESTFLILQKAYLEDFTNEGAIREIERMTAKIGRWEELIAVVNTKLTELGNRSEACPLYLQVGRWYGERLGNIQYATLCYGKVLQMDPENIGALSAIADLYKTAGQWDNYVHYLKMQAEKAKTDDTRKEIMIKLGRTYEEELARPDDAIDSFRQALAIDSANLDALSSLEVLYRQKEMWKDLISVLEKKVAVLGDEADPEERIELLMSLGEVYETRAEDPVSAGRAFHKVVEIDERQVAALRGLERLFTSMEKWQDLLDVLEIHFNVTEVDREKVEILTQMARMLEKEFQRPEQAVERYEQVLLIDPDNENALDNLERIYRQEKRWENLVETYSRHVMVAEEDEKKTGMLLAKGRIHIEEMEDSERGIETYRQILDIDESHPEALDILARLYEHSERYPDALEMLERLLHVTMEPTQKVELLYRMGVILDQQLVDRDAATARFQESLSIDPGHIESLGALRTIYIDQEEWDYAEQILDREQECTTIPAQRSELLYARGRILRDFLHRPEEAIECFRQAMELDPENEQAAEPLVEHFLLGNMYAEAEPLLDMLLRRWAKKPPQELLPYHLSLAKVTESLGNDEKALKCYRAAFEIDASNIETLKGMALILYKLQQWDKSFKYYQMILVQHIDQQNDAEKVDIYYHLGNIKLNVNEPRKALNMYEKALGIDPHHRLTLEALIGLFEKQRDFEQVIHFKKTIAESVGDDEKFEMLIEIGDIWQDKLSNSAKAISSYNEALQIKADDRTLLHKLMTQYSNTKQWAKAVDILKQVAEMEEDTQRKARYFHSIGVIYHQEVKDSDSAIEFFNFALDSDPDNLKDFEAIEQILTPRRDWKALERNYRKMLHRVAGKGKKAVEEALWHGLGEIYRTRMQNFEAASEAFKMASALDPDNQLRHEILAELYSLIPEKWQDAVKEHQTLIRQNPNRVESYRALRRIYQEARQYDRAWCLCSTLNFLKKADAEEQRFFDQYRMKGMARAQSPLDNEAWIKNLFHPDEDPYIGKIFEVVTSVVRPRKIQQQKAYGLKKKDKKDPFTSTEAFARIYGTCVRVLNLPLPELYVRYDQPFGLQYAITDPPASVVGQSLLSGYTPQDLTFIIAKHLAYYRGEHYIRLLEPTTGGLKALLLASMKLALPGFQIPQDVAAQITPVVQILQSSLLPVQAEQLKRVVRAFSESKASADLKRWAAAVELTACRAGLLLSNDLEVAVRMVNNEPPGFSDVPPKEKVMQLILFSVSEEYFRLREALGITIGT